MDAKIKADWIKALRSGEFKQLRNRLCDGERYCCLGVGLVVALPGTDASLNITSYATDVLGLTAEQQDCLVDMNDGQGKSFSEIADYIEEHL